jgi:hypothetical protein
MYRDIRFLRLCFPGNYLNTDEPWNSQQLRLNPVSLRPCLIEYICVHYASAHGSVLEGNKYVCDRSIE